MHEQLIICFAHIVGCPPPPFVARKTGGNFSRLFIEPADERETWTTQSVNNGACSAFFDDVSGLRHYLKSIRIRRSDASKVLAVAERYFKHRSKQMKKQAKKTTAKERIAAVQKELGGTGSHSDEEQAAIIEEARNGGSLRTKPLREERSMTAAAGGRKARQTKPRTVTEDLIHTDEEETTTMAKAKKTGKKAAVKKTAGKVAKKAAAKKAAAKKAAGKVAASNGRGGIGAYARELIAAGKLDTDGIVAAVKKKFPDSAFKANHVSWYRSHM